MSYSAETTNAQMEKSAVWQIPDRFTKVEVEEAVVTAHKVGQFVCEHKGQIIVITPQSMEEYQ